MALLVVYLALWVLFEPRKKFQGSSVWEFFFHRILDLYDNLTRRLQNSERGEKADSKRNSQTDSTGTQCDQNSDCREEADSKRKNKRKSQEAPILLYVMLLVSIATLLMAAGTFYLDALRVPLLFFVLTISGFVYWAYGVDHYFDLHPADKSSKESHTTEAQQKSKQSNGEPKESTLPILSAIDALQHRTLPCGQKGSTLVVVCAAGGGIQAAGWTARTLTGLLHSKFHPTFILCWQSINNDL